MNNKKSLHFTPEELRAIDCIVEKEKGKAKVFKTAKEFSAYIKKLTNKPRQLPQARCLLSCFLKQNDNDSLMGIRQDESLEQNHL